MTILKFSIILAVSLYLNTQSFDVHDHPFLKSKSKTIVTDKILILKKKSTLLKQMREDKLNDMKRSYLSFPLHVAWTIFTRFQRIHTHNPFFFPLPIDSLMSPYDFVLLILFPYP